MVVDRVSRKYSVDTDLIIFGASFSTHPSFSRYIVSSKYAEARVDQIEQQVYQTPNDFETFDLPGVARLSVDRHVEHGTDMVVLWEADTYGLGRISTPDDWIGLYRVGECDDDSDLNLDNVIHKCWLAWRYVYQVPGFPTGQVSFTIDDYKAAGDYELRYFYGDSSGGQGYECVTLGDVGQTYKRCLLRARGTSSAVSVVLTGRSTFAQSVPGLQEHYCDGADGLCTW